MFKRTLIVLALAAAVVFVPWVVGAELAYNFLEGMFPSVYYETHCIDKWAYGFVLICIVAVPILLFIVIIEYIKHG